MILLTGATGTTGATVAKMLIEKGAGPLRALVRNAEKAAWLKDAGVELVIGDASDRDMVAHALTGVERALLILVNEEEQLDQEKQFVDLAKAANVKHIVKLSSMEAVADATAPIPQCHWASEDYIRASGLDWTMVKPNYFSQNMLANAPTIQSEGKFYLPMGDGKVGISDVRDHAEVIVKALTEEGHAGKSYNITGPELLTFHQIADIFSDVLGRQIDYVDQPLDDYLAFLAGFGLSAWRVAAVGKLFEEIEAGGLDHLTDTVQEVLGRPPIPLKQFVADYRSAFEA